MKEDQTMGSLSRVMGSGLVPQNDRSSDVGAYNAPCDSFLRSSCFAPARDGFLASPEMRLQEVDFQKKAVDYSDWFSRPCAQKDGRVWFECSSIGWIYMLRGQSNSPRRFCLWGGAPAD